MRKILVLLVAVCFIASCGLTKEKLGMARSKPDETKVLKNGAKKRGDLVIPPDYNIRP
jgi:hypothetical protein